MNEQSKRIELQFIFHGGIILIFGMFLGFPYAQSINQELGADSMRAWKAVHLAALTLGTMLIALGVAARRLEFSRREANVLILLMVLSSYIFSAGMGFGAIVGQRGIKLTEPAVNLVMFTIFWGCIIGTIIGTAIFIRAAYWALRKAANGTDRDTPSA